MKAKIKNDLTQETVIKIIVSTFNDYPHIVTLLHNFINFLKSVTKNISFVLVTKNALSSGMWVI